MQLLKQDIFGRRQVRTPASERAVRCARLRVVNIAVQFRIVSMCVVIALSGIAADVFLGAALQERQVKRLIPAGFVLPDSGVGLLSPFLFLVALMVPVAFIGWLLPLIVRSDKKFETRVSVESLRKEQKKRAILFGIVRRYGRVLCAACVVVLVAMAVFVPKTDRNLLLHMSAVGGWFAGVNMIGLGLFARRGKHLVCGRCEHEMRSWRSAGAKCGECGWLWKEPWNAKVGEKCVRRERVGWGVGFAAVSMGFFVWVQLSRG